MKTSKTQQSMLKLALAITAKNVKEGTTHKRKTYVTNKTTKPKVKAKNHGFKTAAGIVYHVRDNMSGNAFKKLIVKSKDAISDFVASSDQIIKL